jgi:hypothetical protein
MRFIVAALAALTLTGAADAQFRPLQRIRDAFNPSAREVCVGPNCPQGVASPAPFVPVPVQAPKPMQAAPAQQFVPVPGGQVVGAPGDRLIRLAKKLQIVRGKIIDGLVAKGVDRADAEKVVGELGDGTLIKFLIEHFDDIMAIVLKLLPLFMDKVAGVFGFYVSGCPV